MLAVLAPIAWPPQGDSDAFLFWYAGRLVVTGGSPYEPSAWTGTERFGEVARSLGASCTSPDAAGCVWAYPPHTAWLFAPFALFQAHVGVFLLSVFFAVAAVAGLVALGNWVRVRSSLSKALLLVACATSHPFVFGIRAGHFEGLGLIGFVAAASGLRSGRTPLLVLGALLMSLKPHLYLALAAAVLFTLVSRRAWRSFAILGAATTLVAVVGLARYPDAIRGLERSSGSFSAYGWANTWAFARSFGPVGIIAVFGCALLSFLVAVRLAMPERRIDTLLAASAALSLAILPYLHPYDLVLSLPAFGLVLAYAEATADRVRGGLVAATVFVLAVGTWLAVAINSLQTSVQGAPGAIPVVAMALLALAVVARRSFLGTEAQPG